MVQTERQNKITHISQLLPEELQEPVPFQRIELTDEEKEQALSEAMVKKQARMEDDRKKRLSEEKKLEFLKNWNTPNELYAIAKYRADQIIRLQSGDPSLEFGPVYFQKPIVTALSLYFTNAPEFEKLDHTKYNTTGLAMNLNKGLWLWGNPGVGKTLMMEMFSRNKRICYDILECPKISYSYVKNGDESIAWLKREIPVEVPEFCNFFQKIKGVCYNDLGTEPMQSKFYGTPINVMQSILLESYEAKVPFWQRFVTTNITLDQVKEFYGVRVLDRIKQCFNIIEVNGKSLRK